MNMYYGRRLIIKIFVLCLLNFLFIINVKALKYGGCEYSTISRMKSIVNNINISYEYVIADENAYFDVVVNNLTPDIYFVDANSTVNYYYKNSNDGEIIINNYKGKSGTYIFYSANSECYGIKLGNKYYKFPTYNKYYNDVLCSDIKESGICQKWANISYDREEFEKKVYEYKNSVSRIDNNNVVYEKSIFNYIVEFYLNYYIYILISIILVCGISLLIIKKRNKFEI